MPTKETLLRALKRAGWAMLMGAGAAFVSVPVDLSEPKSYLVVVSVSLIAGALMGLQKLVSGYIKYDKK